MALLEQQRLRRQLLTRLAGGSGTRRTGARAPRRTPRRSAPGAASVRPGVNGTVTFWPAALAACLHRSAPTEDDQVREGDPHAAGLRAVELLLDPLEGLEGRGELARVVDRPVLLRVPDASVRRWPHPACRCRGSWPPTPTRWRPAARWTAPSSSSFCLEVGDRRFVADQLVLDGAGPGPARAAARDPRAEEARHRPHVAVEQLVPGPGEGVGELVGVVAEALGDLPVLRVGDAAPGRWSPSSARAGCSGPARPAPVSAPAPSFGCHCWAPAGLWPSSHS